MNVTIVDYKSGNISSVINSFKEVAENKVKIEVTSDVAIHQLFFDENVINNFNSDYHVIPPFRTNEDLISLRKAISTENISAICSDHQPHNADARQVPFSSTLPGISSIEVLLP